MGYTKGPWAVDFEQGWTIGIRDGIRVASISDRNSNDTKTNQANADLIAAAPEMLEALELCLKRLPISQGSECSEVYIKTLEAITKARGESLAMIIRTELVESIKKEL